MLPGLTNISHTRKTSAMLKIVLVIILISGEGSRTGNSVSHIEFDSRSTCQSAAEAIKNANKNWDYMTVAMAECFER